MVTGANSGLGLRVATVLALRGARVLLACRSPERGREAVAAVPGSRLVLLDLADLDSVRRAAAEIRELTGDRLELLVNNAGIPAAREPRDAAGHESVLAVNHLGHAALTWQLLPTLRGGAGSRVVTVGSGAARMPGFDIDDLDFTRRRYRWTLAYPQSKLANLVFAQELARRLAAAGWPMLSVTAHPGFAATNLARAGAHNQGLGRALAGIVGTVTKVVSQSVREAALPILYAATASGVHNGDYFGPTLLGENYRGVGPAALPATATDPAVGHRLWQLTAEMTALRPPIGTG